MLLSKEDLAVGFSSGGMLTGNAAAQQTTTDTNPGKLTVNVDPAASGPVYLGGSEVDATGFPLFPGQAWEERVAKPSDWFVFAATGDKVGVMVTR